MAKIIITDDEPMNLRMAEFVLKKNGYETVKASSGAECLDKLSEGADLALLDVLMPEMNGFQTYEKLREIDPEIPVIFLTAAQDDETLEKVKSFGTMSVHKPFKPEELISAVNSVLK